MQGRKNFHASVKKNGRIMPMVTIQHANGSGPQTTQIARYLQGTEIRPVTKANRGKRSGGHE